MYKIIFFISILFFTGCENIVTTKVKVSELLSKEEKNLQGNIFIEIPSCNDYKDSRNPSSSLIKAKDTIPQLFEGSKYKECFSKKMKSYAEFILPIRLSKDKGYQSNNKYIGISSDNSNLLYLYIPKRLQQKIAKFKKSQLVKTDLKVLIKLENDTKKDVPFSILSAFIDNKPYIYGNGVIKKGQSFILTLSDVSLQNALTSDYSFILMNK